MDGPRKDPFRSSEREPEKKSSEDHRTQTSGRLRHGTAGIKRIVVADRLRNASEKSKDFRTDFQAPSIDRLAWRTNGGCAVEHTCDILKWKKNKDCRRWGVSASFSRRVETCSRRLKRSGKTVPQLGRWGLDPCRPIRKISSYDRKGEEWGKGPFKLKGEVSVLLTGAWKPDKT